MRVSTSKPGCPPRLLAVFAHPDDEVFCAGGTLARWAAEGGETMVISATRGEAGQIQDGQAATRRTLGEVRARELRTACARLGVRRVVCHDYQDGALQDVDVAILVDNVKAHIQAFRPDVVVTFGPDGGSGHPDHVAISAATTRACQQVAEDSEHAPSLCYAAFPRRHHLLCHQLARRLVPWRDAHPVLSGGFVRAFALLAEEAILLGYADDTVEARWFPSGVSLVEQGEPANCLYLIISGHADVIAESAEGTRRLVRRVGPGHFFGEEALARRQPHAASLVAAETVTCLALSAHAPTPFDGRGGEPWAPISGDFTPHHHDEVRELDGLTCLDVSQWLDYKVAALAAHRTQFALDQTTMPSGFLDDWLGREYFTTSALVAIDRDAGIHATTRAYQHPARPEPDLAVAPVTA